MDKEPPKEASTTKYTESHERTSTPTEFSSRTTAASSPPNTSQAVTASDTFLRFPRPQGSSDLANWISNSDPNIMHRTPSIEDSGLSDSTYELIHEDVDIESQDGYHTESMTASVCSLDDTGRADDVHSLAGTERTVDTESAVDETEQMPQSVMMEQPEYQEQIDTDEEPDRVIIPTLRSQIKSYNDAASQESMEYTQQSLGTPSSPVPTIEEPKILEAGERGLETTGASDVPNFLKAAGQIWEQLLEHVSRVSWTLRCIFILLLLLISVPRPSFLSFKTVKDEVSSIATTSLTTTEAFIATSLVPSALATPTPPRGMALISLENANKPGLFSPKYPQLVFTPSKNGEILVTIPDDAMAAWSTKNCLYIGASREDDKVDVDGSFTHKGAVLRIPKKEAHGIVKLVVESRCGPKFSKVLDVHFSKGRIEEAYERTKCMVMEMKNVLPVAAQEAGRGYNLAKQSFGSIFQYFEGPLVRERIEKHVRNFAAVTVPVAHLYHKARLATITATQTSYKDVKKDFKITLTKAKGFFKKVSAAHGSMLDRARSMNFSEAMKLTQLKLVDAQISAKLWWLKQTGRKDEYENYAAKAKEHLKRLRGYSPQSVRDFAKSFRILNPRHIRQGLCSGLKARGYSGPKFCKAQVIKRKRTSITTY